MELRCNHCGNRLASVDVRTVHGRDLLRAIDAGAAQPPTFTWVPMDTAAAQPPKVFLRHFDTIGAAAPPFMGTVVMVDL